MGCCNSKTEVIEEKKLLKPEKGNETSSDAMELSASSKAVDEKDSLLSQEPKPVENKETPKKHILFHSPEPLFYRDPSGCVIHFADDGKRNTHPPSIRDNGNSIEAPMKPTSEVYLVPSEWIREWKRSLKGENVSLGKIPTHKLTDPHHTSVREDAVYNKDFDLVSKELWEYLFKTFGTNGPVLLYYVPEGLPVSVYLSEEWTAVVDFHASSTVIIPASKESATVPVTNLQSRMVVAKKTSEAQEQLRIWRCMVECVCVQAMWRRYVQRRKFLRALMLIMKCQRIVRGVLARKRVTNLMRRVHPHNIVITMKCASSMNIGDSHNSDPYVVVSGYKRGGHAEQEVLHRADSGAQKHIGSIIAGPEGYDMTLTSYEKTHVEKDTLDPVWMENILVTDLAWDSDIVLTYLDHDLIGSDDFLGQNCFNLKNYQSIYRGGVLRFNNFPIKSLAVNVEDPDGKPLVPHPEKAMSGKGTVTFEVRLPSLGYSMCGWMWKKKGGIRSVQGLWEKRWMVLVDYKLCYFEDQFSLNKERGHLICDNVTRLSTEVNADGEEEFSLHYQDTKTEHTWHLRLVAEDSPQIKRMWMRKIRRCCPQVPDLELGKELDKRFVLHTVRATHHAPMMKTCSAEVIYDK